MVVWSGDPFELTTRAEHVFIGGREMSMDTRQKQLFEKYPNDSVAARFLSPAWTWRPSPSRPARRALPPALLTGLANATRTGRGPSGVFADISKPYRSTPVIVAEVTSVAFENALQ